MVGATKTGLSLDEDALTALADRLLDPDRGADREDWLARADAVPRERLVRARDGDSWRSLAEAGLLPTDWVANPSRRFRSSDGLLESAPRSFGLAVSVASMQRAMARVEELARESARALVAWGGVEPATIVWRFFPSEWRVRQRSLRTDAYPSRAMLLAGNAAVNLAPPLEDAWDSIAVRLSSRRGRSAAARIFERDVADAEAWSRAVEAGVEVRPWPVPRVLDRQTGRHEPLTMPVETYGRCFRDLPDPFAPVLEIWRLGMALDCIARDAIELVAPVVAGLVRR